MSSATKKYIVFGLAICLLFLSINFIGFETTLYIESALKGTCDTLVDEEFLDCSLCNCNKKTINCEFQCKTECDLPEQKQTRHTRSEQNHRPINQWHTSKECFRTPDYTDICIYEEICFNGKESLYFVTPTAQDKRSIRTEKFIEWDARYRFPKPFPPSENSHYVPIGANSFARNLFAIPPSKLNSQNTQIFDKGVMWIARPELDVLNPFFFAKDTLNFFEAMMINETEPIFPPMDYVAILRNSIPPGWATEFLPAVIQDDTNVVLLNYFSDLQISDNKLMCFPKAVIIGDKPRLFSGPYHAQRFKERLFSKLNLPAPVVKGFGKTDVNVAPRVIVTKRADNNPRAFYNLQELRGILDHYSLNYTILEPFKAGTSLKSQVEILSEADVYITVHGGGVINSLFLPIHSSLIEIFPYGLKNKVYEYSTFSSGIHYQAVRSWIKPPPESTSEIFKKEFYDVCQNVTSLEHNELFCVHWCKNAPTYIPMREFELALIESLDTQGYLLPIRASQSYFSLHKSKIPLNDWHWEGNWISS